MRRCSAMSTTEIPPTAVFETTAGLNQRPPAATRRRRRRFVERLTPGLIVGVIAALVAFVVIAGLLRDRRDMTTVVVPARSMTAGEPITAADVEMVEIPTEIAFSDDLVSSADLDTGAIYAGRVLREGEPILRSSTSDSAQADDRRTMALPLPDWGAAGGPLAIGDEIDVIDTDSDEPRYIVQRAAIVARSTDDNTGGIGAQRGVWVSIEVTEAEALDVAGVVDEDSFIIVRSGSGS